MRTTLVLPDDLYREVKATAALQGRTVTSLLEECLRDYVSSRGAPAQLPPLPRSQQPSGLTTEFRESGVDISDTGAVLEWLDEVERRGT